MTYQVKQLDQIMSSKGLMIYVRCPIDTRRSTIEADLGETIFIDGDEYTPLGFETFCVERVAKGTPIGVLIGYPKVK